MHLREGTREMEGDSEKEGLGGVERGNQRNREEKILGGRETERDSLR